MNKRLSALMARLAAERIHQVLEARLTYRQREVVKLRSGAGDGTVYTRPECAHVFDTTVATIGRVEAAAVAKLKAVDPSLWELLIELGKMRKRGAL